MLFPVFARPKPCRIMMLLREPESAWHLSKLAKSSDTSYVYVTHLISELEKGGLVLIESKGKKRMVKLTEKGLAAANIIHELMSKLE
jgi:predicted transcriptional regulator